MLLTRMQVFGKAAPYAAFFLRGRSGARMAAAGFEILERARHASRGEDARPFLVAKKTVSGERSRRAPSTIYCGDARDVN